MVDPVTGRVDEVAPPKHPLSARRASGRSPALANIPGLTVMVAIVALVAGVFAAALVGCGERAEHSVRKAGASLERAADELSDAAVLSAEKVDDETREAAERVADKTEAVVDETVDKTEEAAERLEDRASQAREELESLRRAADLVADPYLDPDDQGQAQHGAGTQLGVVHRQDETYEVKRSALLLAMASPDSLVGQTTVRTLADGSMELEHVDTASPVGTLDVRPGDRLVEVEGEHLADLDPKTLVSRAQEQGSLTATVERDGERLDKTIVLVD